MQIKEMIQSIKAGYTHYMVYSIDNMAENTHRAILPGDVLQLISIPVAAASFAGKVPGVYVIVRNDNSIICTQVKEIIGPFEALHCENYNNCSEWFFTVPVSDVKEVYRVVSTSRRCS